MFIGILLLAFGVLMILEKANYIEGPVWDYIWPVSLIALGLDFLLQHFKKPR